MEYTKITKTLSKNKSNVSQKFEKISSDKNLKKDSSGYSRASGSNKYYSINSQSERGHKVDTQRLRKDIREITQKNQRTVQQTKQSKAKLAASEVTQGKTHEVRARIKAKLVCKQLSNDELVSNEQPKQSKIMKLNSSKSIGENESEQSTRGKDYIN